MIKALRRLRDDRAGVTAIEYAVILSLIAMSIVLASGDIGTNLAQTFTALDGVIAASNSGGSGSGTGTGGGTGGGGGGTGGGDHHDGGHGGDDGH